MWPEFELGGPVLVTCKFDDDPIKTKSFYRVHVFSIISLLENVFNAQGHVTKRIIRSGFVQNLSKILCLSSLSASLKKIRSKLKVLSCPQYFSSAQGQVPRHSIDGCVRNSNSFEPLWLSWFPASLMTIRQE